MTKRGGEEGSWMLVLGDEAAARAAIDSGAKVHGYPGTPWTEAGLYYFERLGYEDWAPNEKVAGEWALGESYAGSRVLVGAKHVGWNVGAEIIVNARMTGVNGGMIIYSADDPSMHSSQNEQDNRYYAILAEIPCIEPTNQQEMYDWTRAAFAISEELTLPIMLRTTTRLAHNRSIIRTGPAASATGRPLADDPTRWLVLPQMARKTHERLTGIDLEAAMDEAAARANVTFNLLVEGDRGDVGIISSGVAFGYLLGAMADLGVAGRIPILRIGSYPAEHAVGRFLSGRKKILVVEEGAPFIEMRLLGPASQVAFEKHGKLDGYMPRVGELSPTTVREGLNRFASETFGKAVGREAAFPSHDLDFSDLLASRPPQLCQGCSHRDTGNAMKTAIEQLDPAKEQTRVFGDIGCYTLVAIEHNLLDTTVEMGASIGMAAGAARSGLKYSIGLIGDSTFVHSGLPTLVAAVHKNTPITLVIADNGTTAMTGMEEVPMKGTVEDVVRGLGVDPEHLKVIAPIAKRHLENVEIIKKEMEYPGLSVIISLRPCMHLSAAERAKGSGQARAAWIDNYQPLPETPAEAPAVKKRIVIAGVGGQGILAASEIIDRGILGIIKKMQPSGGGRRSLFLQQPEVHGMAQRGGSVLTNVLIANEPIQAGMVGEYEADVLLGFDILETARNMQFLRPGGLLICSTFLFPNIGYDHGEALLARLMEWPGAILFDAHETARQAGDARAQNSVILGAFGAAVDAFPAEYIEALIREQYQTKRPDVIEANVRAFRFGSRIKRFFDACRKSGLSTREIHAICRASAAAEIDPALAAAWKPLFDRNGETLTEALASCKVSVAFGADPAAIIGDGRKLTVAELHAIFDSHKAK